ncbi:methyltransferase FkbM family [Crinalium epipsammum PCC 9333]|uniref:Methyltransferase FkbM family n=1 Tax=Crinalium epipsammum PCC 9333 TaxID=1173022 RepID=K9W1L6_9CYAN|nr:FkbM family methyltransferase [Crinalium epipsammum]AFZ13627.1 methyltransferase FkbM family [Crinalium epipsammum PCC 9333]
MMELIVKVIKRMKSKTRLLIYRNWIYFCKSFKYLKQKLNKIKEETELFISKEEQKKTFYFIEISFKDSIFKMILERPGHIEDYIVQHGAWEPHISDLITFFMKENGIFLDVGANIGYHSLYIASSFENSECICFEPNSLIYQQLNRNIKLNNRLKNIRAYDVAISNFDGEVEFYMQDESPYNRGISSLTHNWDLKLDTHGVKQISVQAAKLDDFLEESLKSRISVIKIDTQGTEYQVICGAMDIIEKSKPVIFFEFETAYQPENPAESLKEILNKIYGFGYKVFLVKSEYPELFYEFDISLIADDLSFEGDFVCLPSDFL